MTVATFDLDWWSLGYTPDDSPRLDLREPALSTLEEYAISPGVAAHVFDFLHGSQKLRDSVLGLKDPVFEKHGREALDGFTVASSVADICHYVLLTMLQILIPRHGRCQKTSCTVTSGVYLPTDWEDFELLQPVAVAVQNVVRRTNADGLMVTPHGVRSDEAFCVMQGAKWAMRQARPFIQPSELSRRIMAAAFCSVIEHHLAFVPAPVIEKAWDIDV